MSLYHDRNDPDFEEWYQASNLGEMHEEFERRRIQWESEGCPVGYYYKKYQGKNCIMAGDFYDMRSIYNEMVEEDSIEAWKEAEVDWSKPHQAEMILEKQFIIKTIEDYYDKYNEGIVPEEDWQRYSKDRNRDYDEW